MKARLVKSWADDKIRTERDKDPEEDEFNAETKALRIEFEGLGIKGSSALDTATASYQTNYMDYLQNKNYYKQWWKQIYGTDIPDFGFKNNPFAMMAVGKAVEKGDYMGFNLADLSVKAKQLVGTVTSFQKLGGEQGSWSSLDTLNYQQRKDLAAIYGEELPTQSELARLETDDTFKVGGKDKGDINDLYEKLRKKRESLFTEEETKTQYQSSQDGLALKNLKSRQSY